MHRMIEKERSKQMDEWKTGYSSYDRDRLDAADKMKIERGIYFDTKGADISPLTALSLSLIHISALIPAWNGAPVSCPGATGKWDFPSRALPPASRRVFRGLLLTDNGERGAMKTLPPATLSFLTGKMCIRDRYNQGTE